jgi:autotransporter-associated beta strand protein
MKRKLNISRIATLVATATFAAETHAQTSQLVYSQNFNAAANDTTGTGLNDGSNMVDNVSSFQPRVWDSTSWGALPAGQGWRALFLTPMDTGVLSNFYMPVRNTGQSVSSFNANFSLLLNYIGYTGGNTLGDGFSINFGKFNNTNNAIGGYLGMYTPAGGTTGNVLTLSFYTYPGDAPRIELSYNGSVVATNPMDPFYNVQNPPPSSAFLPVNFSYDANGVDVTYNGTSVFSNVAVAGFTPGVNDSFAMAGRTGVDYQNTFVDDIAINTTVAPFVWSAGTGNWTTAGGWTIGTAPTTNNNWIVMSGAGGNVNNNAVTAVQGLSFASNASGSYSLSGNAMTVGADGITNNSSRVQTVSSDLTLGASQTFNAASGALSFDGTINAGNNTLSVSGNNAVTINGAISGTGASLAKSGSGNLTLGGANTYSGGTTISAGRLIGTSSSLQGAVTNNAALEFAQSSNGTYSGNINGSGSFTKSGTGTLTLTGNNTYTGATTVSTGKLVINGNVSASSTSVSSGATLGGIGTVGPLTIQSGGIVAPGNSPGILTVNGNYTQAGQYTAEIAGTTAGSGYDQINVLGTVDISGGSLVTAFSGSYAKNDLLFILLNDGTDAINGTFAGYAQGATVASYGYMDWQISYTANSATNQFTGGNDIALMAIPEPSSCTVAGIGLAMLLGRRSRSRKNDNNA